MLLLNPSNPFIFLQKKYIFDEWHMKIWSWTQKQLSDKHYLPWNCYKKRFIYISQLLLELEYEMSTWIVCIDLPNMMKTFLEHFFFQWRKLFSGQMITFNYKCVLEITRYSKNNIWIFLSYIWPFWLICHQNVKLYFYFTKTLIYSYKCKLDI